MIVNNTSFEQHTEEGHHIYKGHRLNRVETAWECLSTAQRSKTTKIVYIHIYSLYSKVILQFQVLFWTKYTHAIHY